MKTSTKVGIGVALAGAAVGAYFLFFRKGTLDKSKAMLGELAVANCGCYFNEYFADGRIKSTPRPRQDCIDDGLDFVGCMEGGTVLGANGAGFDPLDPSTWANIFS